MAIKPRDPRSVVTRPPVEIPPAPKKERHFWRSLLSLPLVLALIATLVVVWVNTRVAPEPPRVTTSPSVEPTEKPTTTPPVVIDKPPLAGIYIIPKRFYESGVPVYGRDIGFPKYRDTLMGVAFDLPKGIEIRAPSKGWASGACRYTLGTPGLWYPCTHIEWGQELVKYTYREFSLDIVARDGAVLADYAYEWRVSRRGEVIAEVVESWKKILDLEEMGEFNILLVFWQYDPVAGENIPSVTLLHQYFSYIPIP